MNYTSSSTTLSCLYFTLSRILKIIAAFLKALYFGQQLWLAFEILMILIPA
jgi:hypothetical protein